MDLDDQLDDNSKYDINKFAQIFLDSSFETSVPNDPKMSLKTKLKVKGTTFMYVLLDHFAQQLAIVKLQAILR